MDDRTITPAPAGRTIRRYAILVASLAAIVYAAIRAGFLAYDNTPTWGYWAAGLIVLVVADFAYGLAAAAAVVAAPAVVVGLRRAKGRERRTAWLRLASLCVSVLFGAVLLEGASAVVLSIEGRGSVMPAGDEWTERDERWVRDRLPSAVKFPELPTTFSDESDHVSIAVVGESSAEGVPYERWLSIGRVVARELGRAIPGRKFHPEVLATSGDTLERQHRNLLKIKHRPDVLILYCGHNEFSARIPISRDREHYADARKPDGFAALAARLSSWSRAHALIRRNIEKCRIAIPPPSNGRRALVDVPAYSPQERELLLADFRRRLEAIADYAESVGSILVLIAPPGNDSDYDPNRSYLPAETPRAERAAIESAYLAAVAKAESEPASAIEGLRRVLDRAPTFAAAHWRLSRLLSARGEAGEAYEHAVAARDFDGYPQRCPTDFQEAYREVAARHDAIYVDGQAYFHAVSPDGLLDDRLFHDAMHPSFRGQIALAQAVLRGLHARRAFGWPADAPPPVVDPAESARHFGLDADVWRALCLWGMMSYEITGPASFDQTLRRAHFAAFARAADAIEAGTPPADVGLPNIGRTEPIPVVPYGDSGRRPGS